MEHTEKLHRVAWIFLAACAVGACAGDGSPTEDAAADAGPDGSSDAGHDGDSVGGDDGGDSAHDGGHDAHDGGHDAHDGGSPDGGDGGMSDGDLGDGGCDADLQTSSEHCGECNHSCRGAECASGECQPRLVAMGSCSGQLAARDGFLYFNSGRISISSGEVEAGILIGTRLPCATGVLVGEQTIYGTSGTVSRTFARTPLSELRSVTEIGGGETVEMSRWGDLVLWKERVYDDAQEMYIYEVLGQRAESDTVIRYWHSIDDATTPEPQVGLGFVVVGGHIYVSAGDRIDRSGGLIEQNLVSIPVEGGAQEHVRGIYNYASGYTKIAGLVGGDLLLTNGGMCDEDGYVYDALIQRIEWGDDVFSHRANSGGTNNARYLKYDDTYLYYLQTNGRGPDQILRVSLDGGPIELVVDQQLSDITAYTFDESAFYWCESNNQVYMLVL